MILPSGNTYSVFDAGLTDVINRSVCSLSRSPKSHWSGPSLRDLRVLVAVVLHYAALCCQLLGEAPVFLLAFDTVCGYETRVCQSLWRHFIVVIHAPPLSVTEKTKSVSTSPGCPRRARRHVDCIPSY